MKRRTKPLTRPSKTYVPRDYSFETWPSTFDDFSVAAETDEESTLNRLLGMSSADIHSQLSNALLDFGIPSQQVSVVVGSPSAFGTATRGTGRLLSTRRRVIRTIVDRVSIRVLESADVTVPITFLTIHSPRVKGATCEYTDTTARSATGSFVIQIAGVKGGLQGKVTVTAAEKYIANAGRCYGISKNVTFRFESVQTRLAGWEGKPYVRSSPIAVEEGYAKEALKASEDACRTPGLRGDHVGQIRFRNARDGDHKLLKIERAVAVSFGLDVNVPKLNTKVTIGLELANLSTKDLDYFFPGKRNYDYYRLPKDFGFAFQTDTPN